MDGLDDAQIVLEVVDEGVFLVPEVLRLFRDLAVEALHPVTSDAVAVEDLPVGSIITIATQERQVRLADADVIRRGVVMQLLVPLLHPGAVLLGDVVAVHDVQNLVADLLCVTAAADAAEHEAHPLLGHTICVGMCLCDGVGEAVLSLPEDAGLRVVVALPRELAAAAVAQPHEDGGHGLRQAPLTHHLPLLHLVQQVAGLVEAVHQRHLI
mmetsp:Transcript_20853/g.62749  ORF Transcript_20853/g.62749 Transcript_20853/m.62749 type:complete len:211 (-) Transcript_20853:1862-2494(-)